MAMQKKALICALCVLKKTANVAGNMHGNKQRVNRSLN